MFILGGQCIDNALASESNSLTSGDLNLNGGERDDVRQLSTLVGNKDKETRTSKIYYFKE